MSVTIHQDDILNFCKNYDGERFHAVFCDPPYHLTSITERFGKASMNDDTKTSEKVRNRSDGYSRLINTGFMGKTWDGGDIAFRSETWEAIGNLMLPGAFGMAFSATRNYHRLAVAIEDAGFLIHPMIAWVQGQGFPKASNPQKLLEKRDDERAEIFEGHRYGAQALKPVIEPIVVFQKPWEESNQLDNIIEYGTGVYDIDGSRVGTHDNLWGGAYQDKDGKSGAGKAYEGGWNHVKEEFEQPSGRWPSGLILQHTPDCKIIGYRDDNYQINRFKDGAKPWGDAVGEDFDSLHMEGKTPVWECAEGCPAPILDEQSGDGQSRYCPNPSEAPNGNTWGGTFQTNRGPRGYDDRGGASRFFYQAHHNLEEADPFYYCAKASKSEKDDGLDKPSTHPTVKPIDLNRYLTGLVLPPQEYAPRRILVPFAGTASEMIGAFLSGWDEIEGVEKEGEYVEIAKARIDHWCKMRQNRLF